MIRTSVAAAALVLVAATAPSIAGPYGYDRPSPYGGYGRAYDDGGYTNRLVVDSYSGRVTFGEAGDDHCVRSRRFWSWNTYGRRVVRPDSGYGAAYGSGDSY
jgi:hypothetical protein